MADKRNEKVVKLLDAIGDLNIGTYADHTIDTVGDAYESLMTRYASSAGKSGGEFFTPQAEAHRRHLPVSAMARSRLLDRLDNERAAS